MGITFKEKNNENPALLWKRSSYSSLASPLACSSHPTRPPFPTSSRRLTSNSLVPCKMELMERAAGAALA